MLLLPPPPPPPICWPLSQLGGIEIMASNGITHAVVDDDFEGALAILQWLAFAPATQSAAPALPLPPASASADPSSPSSSSVFTTASLLAHLDAPLRDIATAPAAKKGDGVDDVRLLLAGHRAAASAASASAAASGSSSSETSGSSTSEWVGGFFDRHSFTEYQAAWAPTVVVARARLGGVAVGAIAVETRSVEVLTPADPAAADRCSATPKTQRQEEKYSESRDLTFFLCA